MKIPIRNKGVGVTWDDSRNDEDFKCEHGYGYLDCKNKGCPNNCQTPPPSPSSESWGETFMDFYFERGKYAGRKLGPEQYISFIKNTIIPAEVERGRRETVEECVAIMKSFASSGSMIHANVAEEIIKRYYGLTP